MRTTFLQKVLTGGCLIINLFLLVTPATASSTPANISIHLPDTGINDTVTLEYWPQTIGEPSYEKFYLEHKFKSVADGNGWITFKIDSITGPGYFSVFRDKNEYSKPKYLLQNFLIEPADNIRADFKTSPGNPVFLVSFKEEYLYLTNYPKMNIQFSGAGSEKYTVKYKFDLYTLKLASENAGLGVVNAVSGEWIENNYWSRSRAYGLQLVKATHLPDSTQQLLTASIFSQCAYSELSDLILKLNTGDSVYYGGKKEKRDTAFETNITRAFEQYFYKDPTFSRFSDKTLGNAYRYPGYLMLKAFVTNRLLQKGANRDNIYWTIQRISTGTPRDKALTLFLSLYARTLSGPDELITNSLQIIHHPFSKQVVQKLFDNISTGMPFYEFSLPDTKGKTVRLTDLRGKIVFIDFWFTGCGACQDYFRRTVHPVEKHFENNPDVVFVTISIDVNREQWLQSVKNGKNTSSKTINLYTEGQGYQHPLTQKYHVSACPYPLIIDKKGKLWKNSGLLTATPDALTKIINEALLL